MNAGREPIDVLGLAVRPLTIAQVEKIEAMLFSGGDAKPGIRLAREIVAIGISRDHAETKAEDLECDVASLGEAMTAILRLGGFASRGEAPAAAGNAQGGSIGEPSAGA